MIMRRVIGSVWSPKNIDEGRRSFFSSKVIVHTQGKKGKMKQRKRKTLITSMNEAEPTWKPLKYVGISSTMTRNPENIMPTVRMGVASDVATWKELELAEMKRPMPTDTMATIKLVPSTIGKSATASIAADCKRDDLRNQGTDSFCADQRFYGWLKMRPHDLLMFGCD